MSSKRLCVNMTHKWFPRDVIYFSYFSRCIPFQIKRYLLKEFSLCRRNGCLGSFLALKWLRPDLSFSCSLRGRLSTCIDLFWRKDPPRCSNGSLHVAWLRGSASCPPSSSERCEHRHRVPLISAVLCLASKAVLLTTRRLFFLSKQLNCRHLNLIFDTKTIC